MSIRSKFASLPVVFVVQLFVLLLLFRSNRSIYLLALGGILLQWGSFLLLAARPGRPAFRALSRLSFAVVAGSGPFAVYSLHNFHDCRVSFEDNLPTLILVFILIPVFLRSVLVDRFEQTAQER